MSTRRAARGGAHGAAPTGGGFPAELLDANDPAWVDDDADARLDNFQTWRARQRRHDDALHAFARERGLINEAWNCLDHHKLRALAESFGQHWPPRRILRETRRRA